MTTSTHRRGPGRPAGERDTRSLILDAAEQLFASQGYALTSTREIAAAAGVRQSMIAYYFQSKQVLFEEVFTRRGSWLGEQRMQNLDALLARTGGVPAVRELLHAYLQPQFDMKASGPGGLAFVRLQARLHNEPEELAFQLRRKVYDASSKRYIALLEQLLPDVDAEDLNWRFVFLIGAYLYMLSDVDRLADLSDGRFQHKGDNSELLTRLTNFLSSGMMAPTTVLPAQAGASVVRAKSRRSKATLEG
ncbi:TetR/AcrR family transcriptional regulator [Kerstersia similis]|uniref:TetR/AcrR family transcriptional regulator n=1 Tax=Kerstersia similis TaxID=206505 RepID=UPI0039F015D0